MAIYQDITMMMTVCKQTTLGVVHVTATSSGWDKDAACIRAIHKAQPSSDIGHNELINPDAGIEMGRGKIAISADFLTFIPALMREAPPRPPPPPFIR